MLLTVHGTSGFGSCGVGELHICASSRSALVVFEKLDVEDFSVLRESSEDVVFSSIPGQRPDEEFVFLVEFGSSGCGRISTTSLLTTGLVRTVVDFECATHMLLTVYS